MNIPESGRKIIFTKTPICSYARTGEVYLATHNPKDTKGDIYLRTVKEGYGTFDRKRMWRDAKWVYSD